MNVLDQITAEYKRSDLPEFHIGDTVKVHIKIKEGSRERIQVFEGFVLKRQGGGVSETFTVRKISSGVGVEKTFPLHSPKIEKIEVVRKGDVRRAKLNYMRQRTGKSARIKNKVYTEEQLRAIEAAAKAAEEAEAEEAAELEAAEAAAEEAVEEAEEVVEEVEAVEAEAEEAVEEAEEAAEEAVEEAEAPAEEAAEEAPAEEADEQ